MRLAGPVPGTVDVGYRRFEIESGTWLPLQCSVRAVILPWGSCTVPAGAQPVAAPPPFPATGQEVPNDGGVPANTPPYPDD